MSNDLDAIVANYLDDVRSIQPLGPYALCGWSFGGSVAFEMARQLVESGEEVDVLIGDASKAKRKLGWEPTVRFNQLVELMVDADLERLKATVR